jgi:F-type H+-transporting ATPase subunit epsilon
MMELELVSLDGIEFKAQAYSIVLPTASGEITILPGHEPLLSLLVPGVITIRKKKDDPDYHLEHYATFGGVLEIRPDVTRVLVDEATQGDEVNESEAQKAHDKALEARKIAKNQVELDKAQALVDRQRVRLQVAGLHRKYREHRR